MLVAFVILAAIFVAVDAASGVRIASPLAAASATRTPTPRPTASRPRATATPRVAAAPGARTGRTPGASGHKPSTGKVTISAATPEPTVLPTPPGGISPPRYGTLLNYSNNTTFSPNFLRQLDEKVIALVNAQRTAHGLAPLSEQRTLDVIAASRSEDLIKRNYFDHFDPTGHLDANGHRPAAVQELLDRNGVPYTEVGENLLRNVDYLLDTNTPKQAVDAWMNSQEHRDNILHASYTATGVGIAAEDSGGSLRVVITQVFLH